MGPVDDSAANAEARRGLAHLLAIAAFVTGLSAYWVPQIPYESTTRLAWMGVACALFLLGGCAGFGARKLTVLGPGALGFWIGWGSHLVLSSTLPAVFRSSHNLLPFEFAFLALIAVPSTMLGSAIGSALARRTHDVMSPPPQLPSWLALAASVIVVALTPWLAQSEIDQTLDRARAKTLGVARAQFAYRAAHPDAGFACRLSDLGIAAGEPTTLGGVRYDSRFEDGLMFMLSCSPETLPRDAFLLAVFSPDASRDPKSSGFCADQSGAVRAIAGYGYRSWVTCPQTGSFVATVARE